MANYKMEAAKACMDFIRPNHIIGLGAGATMAYLAGFIAESPALAETITLVSSSFKTRAYLQQRELNVKMATQLSHIDVYFDGCDCFDAKLNALKSGGGIHTSEKILAAMADEFILVGDESKLIPQWDNTYPLVIEILPEALLFIEKTVKIKYPDVTFDLRLSKQKDGAVITENGNYLADLTFPAFSAPELLDRDIKQLPGIVGHSLFYGMATKAIIAGEHGVRVILPE
jgi:ribose 5-phosphate isomerase A